MNSCIRRMDRLGRGVNSDIYHNQHYYYYYYYYYYFLDAEAKVAYKEIVSEVTEEPDYSAAMAALRMLL